MDAEDLRILLVTAPADAARPVADRLLDERLAACVNLLPGARSLFWWDGKKDEAEETLLVVKTRADLVDRATAAIVDAHPYDVPEVLALPVVAGHPPYVDWALREAHGGADLS